MRHARLYPIYESSDSIERLRYFVRVVVGWLHQVRGTKVAQKQSQEEVENLEVFVAVLWCCEGEVVTYHKIAYHYCS